MSVTIRACPLPDDALLLKYATGGNYTDCYVTEIDGETDLATYIQAFYTTALFKFERAILVLAGRPSTDQQAMALAHGERSTFAAWHVEDRVVDQLLMCDMTERTRSWLMIERPQDTADKITRLYFGSVVTVSPSRMSGRRGFGLVFWLLLGFHKLYSQALLLAVRAKLRRSKVKVSA